MIVKQNIVTGQGERSSIAILYSEGACLCTARMGGEPVSDKNEVVLSLTHNI